MLHPGDGWWPYFGWLSHMCACWGLLYNIYLAYQMWFVLQLCINNWFLEVAHVFQSVWTWKKIEKYVFKNYKVQNVQTWTKCTVQVWFRFGKFVGGSGSGLDKRGSELDWTEPQQHYVWGCKLGTQVLSDGVFLFGSRCWVSQYCQHKWRNCPWSSSTTPPK